MKIPANSYPVAHTPLAPVPRREDVRAEDPVEPAREAAAAQRTASTTQAGLSADMLQAALRGRSVDAGSSFSSRQALAEYVDISRRDAGDGPVQVAGFDAYA